MNRLVIDASIAVKWFLTEVYSDCARKALNGDYELLAPELLISEFGNVFWKRTRNGEVTEEQASAAVGALLQMSLQLRPSSTLILPALEIANRTQRSIYDSLYVTLAVAENIRVVTADSKLFNALKSTPLAKNLMWVEELTS